VRVLEIFASLQGEGINLGKPAVFVRLAGCPIRCVYCDTEYSWDFNGGVEMPPGEAMRRAEELGVRGHVVVTGGEPLVWMRRGLKELVCGLRRLGAVEVETSGVYAPTPELDVCVDFYDVSPKLSNAGVKAPLSPFYLKSPKAWFKFVVTDTADVGGPGLRKGEGDSPRQSYANAYVKDAGGTRRGSQEDLGRGSEGGP